MFRSATIDNLNQKPFVIIYLYLRYGVDSLLRTFLTPLFHTHRIPYACTPIPCLWLPFRLSNAKVSHSLILFDFNEFRVCFSCLSIRHTSADTKVSHSEHNYCAITTIFVENQKSCRNDQQIRLLAVRRNNGNFLIFRGNSITNSAAVAVVSSQSRFLSVHCAANKSQRKNTATKWVNSSAGIGSHWRNVRA